MPPWARLAWLELVGHSERHRSRGLAVHTSFLFASTIGYTSWLSGLRAGRSALWARSCWSAGIMLLSMGPLLWCLCGSSEGVSMELGAAVVCPSCAQFQAFCVVSFIHSPCW